ncbi:MAG TPA: prepilin-type N-terminal cleavage/methylation domain-containing protein [Mycobacteriales bacterium]|nr:prepilin-type N-terminal cleavage/methylation domain-containing protein [Mycobacteriales bacterium]
MTRTHIFCRDGERDDGFTLIELLVVIIIIGILAAIAIPVFLNQRQKGYDAASKSDLRNLANFEEIYLNDFNTYGSAAAIQASEPKLEASNQVTLTVVRYDGENGYCLSAVHLGSPTVWYYDSEGGGLQPEGSTGCPATTTGVPGGTIVG